MISTKIFSDNLDFDLASSCCIAAISYMALGTILLFTGYVVDWLQMKGILATTQVRKNFNCNAFLPQTCFMMLAVYQQNRVLVIIFIPFGASLGALETCGYCVNHLDIASQYASILIGLSNTVGTIPGIFSLLIVAFIVTDLTVSSSFSNRKRPSKPPNFFRMQVSGYSRLEKFSYVPKAKMRRRKGRKNCTINRLNG